MDEAELKRRAKLFGLRVFKLVSLWRSLPDPESLPPADQSKVKNPKGFASKVSVLATRVASP
jgi:hypothetical protein